MTYNALPSNSKKDFNGGMQAIPHFSQANLAVPAARRAVRFGCRRPVELPKL
jgi:hypothetical protein